MKNYLVLNIFLIAFAALPSFGQPIPADSSEISYPEPAVRVGNIFIEGNKKTRDIILLREIPFRSGDKYTLEELVKKFGIARRQLLNTTLFTEVIVAAKNIEGDQVDVLVEVKERWYIFPVPYFRPADRNLNQWIVEQNASLKRVNYGLKLFYNNPTGSHDKLRFSLASGYTRQIGFSYDRLYIDRKMKWGMKLGFNAGKNHEINYNTVNDKQVFLKDENDFVRKFTSGSVQLTYRKAIKTRHSFGIGYTTEVVADTIVRANPEYFKAGRNRISFPGISYSMSYYDLDYIPYPTKGYAAEVSIAKSGWDRQMNLWQLNIKGLGYWNLDDNLFFSVNMYGGIKLPFKQPYFNQRFLGYGDVYLQGFEYYVIDGAAGGYIKTALNKRLLNITFKTPPRKKGKDGQTLPIGIYGKVFGNAGYVYNENPGENSLSNTMLWSGGIGIDILTLYDITFKIEWSFNSLGQNGLFLHRKTIF
ncbi:MAG: POTRA domain-containing protein [Chitinophagaceae bacterium]